MRVIKVIFGTITIVLFCIIYIFIDIIRETKL